METLVDLPWNKFAARLPASALTATQPAQPASEDTQHGGNDSDTDHAAQHEAQSEHSASGGHAAGQQPTSGSAASEQLTAAAPGAASGSVLAILCTCMYSARLSAAIEYSKGQTAYSEFQCANICWHAYRAEPFRGAVAAGPASLRPGQGADTPTMILHCHRYCIVVDTAFHQSI